MTRSDLLCGATMSGLVVPLQTRAAHEMVRNVACAMAREVYEEVARDNQVYAAFPSMQQWVEETWCQYLPDARNTLVDMLANDGVPQAQKDEIEEALALDLQLLRASQGTMH